MIRLLFLLAIAMTTLRWTSSLATGLRHSRLRLSGYFNTDSPATTSSLCTGRRQCQSALAVSAPNGDDASHATTDDEETPPLHPDQMGPLPQPASLSPSAVLTFKACPQAYLLQYLWKLRQPASLATVKGIMCHEALEHVFSLDPAERTLETLHNLLRVSWGKERLSDKYRFLFEDDQGRRDLKAEKEWGESALKLLQNYYALEDPREIARPNPLKREIWLHAHLAVDPVFGITSSSSKSSSTAASKKPATFYMRGIVDRLDMVRLPTTRGVALKIVDYKTGKAPTLKYTTPVNERIVEESFYQLKVYALMLREKGAGKDDGYGSHGGPNMSTMDLRYLELMYLTSESGEAKPLQYDLGETQEERDAALQDVHQDLSQVYSDISDLVARQDPMAFVGCSRSFCYCHTCRERFVPGTLWRPDQ